MKKTIIIVILVVYIASIVVVNFFGLQIKEFDGIDYVEEIKCESITVLNENPKNYGVTEVVDGLPVFKFDFIEASNGEKYTNDPASLASNPNAIRINYDVLPHSADESQVRFEFEEKNYVYFDEATETFVFLKNYKSFKVKICATDGSNKSITIEIKSR